MYWLLRDRSLQHTGKRSGSVATVLIELAGSVWVSGLLVVGMELVGLCTRNLKLNTSDCVPVDGYRL